MKKETINEFKDGLILDLHPIVTPKTVLTDCLNGTFITYNGNEFCLQNDRGNISVAGLNAGFIPIGIKEYNGIVYIVSYNENKNLTEIGTYPGINWNVSEGSLLSNEYTPLKNLVVDDYIIKCKYTIDELNDAGYDVEEILETVDGHVDNRRGYIIGGIIPISEDDVSYIYFDSKSDRDDCYDLINQSYQDIFETQLNHHYDIMQFESDYDLTKPVTVDIQNCYDGSVNIILVAKDTAPKIINSGFSLNGNNYTILTEKRNQIADTNVYHLDKISEEASLIRFNNKITNIDLLGVSAGGQFKGGNYTFYIKFGDADYNQTDIVAQSGIVSIFNGNDNVPNTINGTLLDERTDKMIGLVVSGLNDLYSNIYIYYSREYSDTNGFRMTEYGTITEPIELKHDVDNDVILDQQTIWLTGFEQTTPIDSELINVNYYTIDSARAETQHSNMLFLGNIEQEDTFDLYTELKEHSKGITVNLKYGESIGKTNYDFETKSNKNNEYYSTKNIYKYLGYWPDEYYRFGIVYIKKDGSVTPVFNMPNIEFEASINNGNVEFTSVPDNNNIFGVFHTPRVDILSKNEITPLCFEFKVPEIANQKTKQKIIGYFIVRQKRIPTTICQGLSIGIDGRSGTPLTYYSEMENNQLTDGWATESFIANTQYLELIYRNAAINITGDIQETMHNREIEQLAQYAAWEMISKTFTYKTENDVVNDVEMAANAWIAQIKQDLSLSETDYDFIDGDVDYAPVEQFRITNFYVTYTIYRIGYEWDNNEKQFEELNPIKYIIIKNTPNYSYWNRIYNNKKVYVSTNGNRYKEEAENYNSNQEYNIDYEESGAIEENKFIFQDKDCISSWGLATLDPCVVDSVSSKLNGSIYKICKEYNIDFDADNILLHRYEIKNFCNNKNETSSKATYIPTNTYSKVVDAYNFSNVAGEAADVRKYKTTKRWNLATTQNTANNSNVKSYSADKWSKEDLNNNVEQNNSPKNINLLRGVFMPFVGLANKFSNNDRLIDNIGIYSIKNDIAENSKITRQQDDSEYYCVSKRINTFNTEFDVYGGDCYTCTVAMRVLRNFTDPTAPVCDQILDRFGWNKYVVSKEDTSNSEIEWNKINVADVNTVSLGYWIVFKCLSSYNLGLRSKDYTHVDEMALIGTERSFYPINGGSLATGNKLEESYILNDGLSATVGRKRFTLMPNVPYTKSEFSNRIVFSNLNVDGKFTNGYRTFQGLSYKDYDKQYGAITKLLQIGQNIFIVMEHGLGLVSVNPKALIQTTTGEAVHIYGYGVLPNEITIISKDYGSKYEHSVINTLVGVYGIDVDAGKIWIYSDKQGFQTISDMKVETYLRDYLKPIDIELGKTDIRTHYNAKKGDLIFTWNDALSNIYSICYNERQNIWVTRYDWMPIVSENINGEFYSLNFMANTELCKIWKHSDFANHSGHVSSWYNDDKCFELEFVVSDPIGLNKIFDDLQIISNNVQPNTLQITVVGDDYEFKRDMIDFEDVEFRKYGRKEVSESYPENPENVRTTSNIHGQELKQYKTAEFYPSYSIRFDYNTRLNQSTITKIQELRDIYKYGRRIGNIQYKGGMWYAQIEPITVNNKQIRIRDKWAKIRIRYSGKDLAIITAIKTLMNV